MDLIFPFRVSIELYSFSLPGHHGCDSRHCLQKADEMRRKMTSMHAARERLLVMDYIAANTFCFLCL
jgi:hypothetical protein